MFYRMRSWLGFVLLGFVVLGCSGAPPPASEPPPVASPQPSPEPEPTVPAELTGDLVRPVLARMDGAVSGCYALEYGGQHDTGGRLVVDWLIAPSGKVESATIAESSFANPSFESCVLEEAQGLEFPRALQPTQLSKPYLVKRDETETTTTGL